MRLFTDRTGLPGPRAWSGQNVPEGKANHPVTDVTWYEAAAYAAFRNKALPTVFQWEKAARADVTAVISRSCPGARSTRATRSRPTPISRPGHAARRQLASSG